MPFDGERMTYAFHPVAASRLGAAPDDGRGGGGRRGDPPLRAIRRRLPPARRRGGVARARRRRRLAARRGPGPGGQRRGRDGQGPERLRPGRPPGHPHRQRRSGLRLERFGAVPRLAADPGRHRVGRAVPRRREGASRVHRGLGLRGLADRDGPGGQPGVLRAPGPGAPRNHGRHHRRPRRRERQEPCPRGAQRARHVPQGGHPRGGVGQPDGVPAPHAAHAVRAERGRGGRRAHVGRGGTSTRRDGRGRAPGGLVGLPRSRRLVRAGSGVPVDSAGRASPIGRRARPTKRPRSDPTTSTSSSARTPTPRRSSSPTATSSSAGRATRRPSSAAGPRRSAVACRSTPRAGSSRRGSRSARQASARSTRSWSSCAVAAGRARSMAPGSGSPT